MDDAKSTEETMSWANVDCSGKPTPERELDALMAEKVMGWTDVEFEGEPGNPLIGTSPSGERQLVPNYTLTIGSAWEVFEKIYSKSPHAKTGVNFSARVLNMEILNKNDPYFAQFGEGKPFTFAHSAPLAICRAALKFVESGGPEGDRYDES